jgi:site-specific DNA recombinase
MVSELMNQCIQENIHVTLNQTEYQNRYNTLVKRFDGAKARLDAVNAEICDKQNRQATIETFLDELKRLDGVTEFQPALRYR